MPVTDIKLLSVLSSQAGIDHVRNEFPDLEVCLFSCVALLSSRIMFCYAKIWTAAVDAELTPRGWIVPGLGDAVIIQSHAVS
jgi:uracil phosphoribosyltransferase